MVKEEHADYVFFAFLDQIKNGEDQLLAPEEMTNEQARTQLEEKKVSGIYYVGSEPTVELKRAFYSLSCKAMRTPEVLYEICSIPIRKGCLTD